MSWKVLFNDNRLKVAFTLFLIWVLAVWHFRDISALTYPLVAIAIMTVFDLSITFVRDHKFYLPFSAIVTGFLIGMILDLNQPAWMVAAAAIAASFSKQFARSGVRQHIFNPAAFGIIVVNIALGTSISWWAVAWSGWPLLILAPLMLRILWSMGRISMPATFVGLYYLLSLITGGSAKVAWETIFDSTLLFFALVMLPEPMTSVARGFWKYSFGILVAVVVLVFSQFTHLAEVFLPALVATNLIAFILRRISKTS